MEDLTALDRDLSISSPFGAQYFRTSLGLISPGHADDFDNLGIGAIFEALTFGVVVTDPRQPDNPIVRVNPAFCEMTGYRAQELIGRNCRVLQGPGTDRANIAEVRAALTEGRTVRRTILTYRKDGTAFWNEMNLSPVRGEDGRLLSYVGIQIDISEQIRRREGAANVAGRGRARSGDGQEVVSRTSLEGFGVGLPGAAPLSEKTAFTGEIKREKIEASDTSLSDNAIPPGIRLAFANRPMPVAQDATRRGVLERLERLSPRERQVLDGIVAGQPNKMIARSLSLSPRTVEVHRSRVMDKMQARNLTDLVRLAVGAGICAVA